MQLECCISSIPTQIIQYINAFVHKRRKARYLQSADTHSPWSEDSLFPHTFPSSSEYHPSMPYRWWYTSQTAFNFSVSITASITGFGIWLPAVGSSNLFNTRMQKNLMANSSLTWFFISLSFLCSRTCWIAFVVKTFLLYAFVKSLAFTFPLSASLAPFSLSSSSWSFP